jgi:preprotein translocase subunit SecE
MDKTNSKILTLSFALFSMLAGLTLHYFIRILSSAFGFIARFTDADIVRHGLPVLFGVVVFAILQFNPRVTNWGEEVISEIKKVVWPSKKDTYAMTIVVIIFLLITSVIVTSFDFFSAKIMALLV